MRARAPGRPVFVARYHGVGRLSHITGLRGPPNGGGHGAGEGPEWVGRHMRANTLSALKGSDGHTRTSNGTGPDTMHAREYSYIGWSGTRGCTLPHSVQLLACGVSPGTAFTKPTSYAACRHPAVGKRFHVASRARGGQMPSRGLREAQHDDDVRAREARPWA